MVMTFLCHITPSPFVLSLPVDETSNLYFDKLSTNGSCFTQMSPRSTDNARETTASNWPLWVHPTREYIRGSGFSP
jgi:hypothetical protein